MAFSSTYYIEMYTLQYKREKKKKTVGMYKYWKKIIKKFQNIESLSDKFGRK